MTELVRSELIHCRPEPWADRARVYIPDLDLTVDGLTARAAKVCAAHRAADALDYRLEEMVFSVGLPDHETNGTIFTDGWRCTVDTMGWNLLDPLERHAFNLREHLSQSLAVAPDPGLMLVVPDDSGTVHVSAPGLGYRSAETSAAFLIGLISAPVVYVPNRFIGDPEPQPFVLPHAVLEKAQMVGVLGSEGAVLDAIRTCRFGTEARALELLALMEEAPPTLTQT